MGKQDCPEYMELKGLLVFQDLKVLWGTKEIRAPLVFRVCWDLLVATEAREMLDQEVTEEKLVNKATQVPMEREEK